ncbi:4Fe-4S dicluster domain-containing protein [Chloroflexota bacterium]
MSEKLLLIDVDRCVGCYACEVACKQENDLPLGPRWCRIIPIGPRELQEELHLDFVPTTCIHCDDPICSYFCPLGAITKREDGIVLIDEDKCNGCGLCVYGCPCGAIYFNQEKKIAGKCSLCVSRIDDGLEPSCVQHCIGRALQFVTEEELDEITRRLHVARTGRVCYASSKWRLSL